MAYGIIKANEKNVVAGITYGPIENGTGDMSVTSGANSVTGSGTTFSSLDKFYVIRKRNWANTYVGKVGNIASATSMTLSRDAAASITASGTTAALGSIQVSTASPIVMGSGTNFSNELDSGMQIYKYDVSIPGYVSLGTISSITSDTEAKLTSFGAINFSGSFYYDASPNWKYQTYTQEEITFNEHLGNGNISTYTANNFIFGSNTTFQTQLQVGYQIFEVAGNLIGEIKSIYSNTKAEFTTLTGNASVNIPFLFYSPVTPNSPNIFNRFSNHLHSAMFEWTRSGLIPGLEQVKSYHPPIPDPVTGMLVNFPAVNHKNTSTSGKKNPMDRPMIDHLPNINYSGGKDHIDHFNDHRGVIGSSNHKAMMNMPINKVLAKIYQNNKDHDIVSTTKNLYTQLYGNLTPPPAPGIVVSNVPLGFHEIKTLNVLEPPYKTYQGPGGNLVYILNANVSTLMYPTIADRIAYAANLPLPSRITDNVTDAQSYFNTLTTTIEQLSDAEKSDLAARATNLLNSDDKKIVKVTGAPIAMPGLLNIVLADEDPANRIFANVVYNKSYTFSLNSFYNRDLPVSNLNPSTDFKTFGPGTI
jgi:hypothetical protein